MMAYGGPDSLDDIEPYLLDIRGGRQTPAELVEEIKERYAQIGGSSGQGAGGTTQRAIGQ
jgi:ferrochelatase